MESSHKDQHHRQDGRLKRKILAIQENQYDTQKGWQQLERQLALTQKPSMRPLSTRKPFIWQAVAAAMILLATGFFAGRYTSGSVSTSTTAGQQLITKAPPSYNQTVGPRDKRGSNSPAYSPKRPEVGQAGAARTASAPKSNQQSEEKIAGIPRQNKEATASPKLYAVRSGNKINGVERQNPPKESPAIITQSITSNRQIPLANKTAKPLESIVINATVDHEADPAQQNNVPESISKPLPVISLSEVKVLSVVSSTAPTAGDYNNSKRSIYRRIGNSSGSMSNSNNPFKIRL